MILRVKFSQDMCDTYPGELGNLMNRLRYRMELAEWRRQMREAKANEDFDAMDRLDRSYDYLGLP